MLIHEKYYAKITKHFSNSRHTLRLTNYVSLFLNKRLTITLFDFNIYSKRYTGKIVYVYGNHIRNF